jgi:hypothetical protein
VRRIVRSEDLGLSRAALRWAARRGQWQRIDRDTWIEGSAPPSPLDRQRARVVASGGDAAGALACVLHGLDSIELDERPMRRRPAVKTAQVGGVPCVDATQALVDVAPVVHDDVWEQALESALRKKLVTIEAIERAIDGLRIPGAARIRRVLARRPRGAPPTESLLETLMVQLARTVPGLGEPVRQLEIRRDDGGFVARVDLCWPELGLFIELDGQQHPGQPVYDARRETAVVAATGWLVGRFTWREVVLLPRTTARRLAELVEQARRRPIVG